jgi:hypothetical protein
MEPGEIAPVIGVRMGKHDGSHFGKFKMVLERTKTTGAKVDHDVR